MPDNARLSGIERAKLAGKYHGRSRAIDRVQVWKLHYEGEAVACIASRLGCTKASVYNVLGERPPVS